MQWSPGKFAGFSDVEPWLPISDSFRTDNVEAELQDRSSMIHLYRRLIAARRKWPALSTGGYRRILAQDDFVLYAREAGSQRILVALNFGSEAMSKPLPAEAATGRVLVSSVADRDGEKMIGRFELRGNEGLLIEVINPAAIA
jgi:alpha-glucosidase